MKKYFRYLGLYGRKEELLAKIGARKDCPHEYVCQIENAALARIKEQMAV